MEKKFFSFYTILHHSTKFCRMKKIFFSFYTILHHSTKICRTKKKFFFILHCSTSFYKILQNEKKFFFSFYTILHHSTSFYIKVLKNSNVEYSTLISFYTILHFPQKFYILQMQNILHLFYSTPFYKNVKNSTFSKCRIFYIYFILHHSTMRSEILHF